MSDSVPRLSSVTDLCMRYALCRVMLTLFVSAHWTDQNRIFSQRFLVQGRSRKTTCKQIKSQYDGWACVKTIEMIRYTSDTLSMDTLPSLCVLS